MGQITADESQAVMATFSTNTRWRDIDFERLCLQDRVIRDPSGAGANFMRFLQNGLQLQVTTTSGIVAPQSGIVRPLTVPVNESRDWAKAVKEAGPDTERSNAIWKVGDQYPSLAGTVERLEQIWLVNFGRGSITPSQNAIAWGKKQHLTPASPRACFAIAEHLPKLNAYLEMDSMAVVSLQECSFEGEQFCCHVWFCGSERRASLGWLENVWLDHYWFAFVRELGSGTLGS